MPHAISQAPAASFARLIAALCAAVAARLERPGRPGLAGPFIVLICVRLQRMAGRVTRLAARAAAGTLAPPRLRPARPRRAGAPHYQRLLRRFGWLVRLVPAAAAGASQLQALLAEPEMTTLIAAAPQIGRTLRPLCRMLGVRSPPALRLPSAATAGRPLPAGPSRTEPLPPPTPRAPGGARPVVRRRPEDMAVLHPQRQSVHPPAHVRMPGRDPPADKGRRRQR